MAPDLDDKLSQAYRATAILSAAMIASVLVYAGVVEILPRLAPASEPGMEPATVEQALAIEELADADRPPGVVERAGQRDAALGRVDDVGAVAGEPPAEASRGAPEDAGRRPAGR